MPPIGYKYSLVVRGQDRITNPIISLYCVVTRATIKIGDSNQLAVTRRIFGQQ